MHDPPSNCPCTSGRLFSACCRPFHLGARPATPEQLMRSRFSAYAMGDVEYVLSTTDPRGQASRPDFDAWRKDVSSFCASTRFVGLEVLSAEVDGDEGRVRFRARLQQGGRDASFAEDSVFVCRDGRWLYSSGRAER